MTFCHHSVIQPFVGLLAEHVPQKHQLINARGFVGSAQPFQSIRILCHLWRHDVFACRVLARVLSRVRRRSRGLVVDVVSGFQHANFRPMMVFARCAWASHASSAPISTLGASGGFSSATRVAQSWWHRFAEHLNRCCSHAPWLPPLASPIPSALTSSLFDHLVALLLLSPSDGRLHCSRIPSICPRHSALCMSIPLEQRVQPIVRPCSLTRASVTYHRFFLCPLVPASRLQVPRQC